MRKESRALNSSIFATLSLVFPEVTVIPGSYLYYYATRAKNVLTDDAATLVKRWRAENINTRYFNSLSIPHLVTPDRLNYVRSAVKYDKNTKINTDFHPISYLYSILVWLSYFPGLINMPVQKILTVKLGSLILWLFALALTLRFAGYRIKAIKDNAIPAVVAVVGFNAMALQLLTIYSFEAIYGYIYIKIGLLIAVFMAGLAAGSYLANARLKQVRIELMIVLLFLSTEAFAIYLNASPKLDYRLSEYLMPVFSFLFASLAGAVFPAAVRDYRSKSLENKAGVLYGCDLLGGAASAVLTSILFIPVFGIMGTIIMPISLCLISLVLLPYSSS